MLFEKVNSMSGFNKDDFIMNRFRTDYPNYNNYDFNKVMQLCSRSGKLSKWLKNVLEDWRNYSSTPDYVAEIIGYEAYSELKPILRSLNTLKADEGKEISDASTDYRKKVTSISNKYKARISECLNNDLVFIINMNSQFLPFSDLVKIIDTDLVGEDRTLFEANVLRDFKTARLEEYKEGTFDRSKWEIL
jgi:hypothetical protein